MHKHVSHLDVWQHVDENKAKPVMFIATDNMKVFVKYTVTIHHFIGIHASGTRGKAAVEIVESMCSVHHGGVTIVAILPTNFVIACFFFKLSF